MKSSKSKKAILLVGHGSRAKNFDSSMQDIAKEIKKKHKGTLVSCAFLEIAPPSIPDAIDEAVQKGADQLQIVPFFVHLGRHVQEDIPAILEEAKKRHPQIRLSMSPYLGYDNLMVRMIEKRLKQTVRKF